jgi:hypothetical protein
MTSEAMVALVLVIAITIFAITLMGCQVPLR